MQAGLGAPRAMLAPRRFRAGFEQNGVDGPCPDDVRTPSMHPCVFGQRAHVRETAQNRRAEFFALPNRIEAALAANTPQPQVEDEDDDENEPPKRRTLTLPHRFRQMFDAILFAVSG